MHVLLVRRYWIQALYSLANRHLFEFIREKKRIMTHKLKLLFYKQQINQLGVFHSIHNEFDHFLENLKRTTNNQPVPKYFPATLIVLRISSERLRWMVEPLTKNIT